MPEYIHSKQTPEGISFRTWSTVVDNYTSVEVNENQLRQLMLYRAVDNALRGFHREILGRIERAKIQGTSEFGQSRSLNGWDSEADLGEPLSDAEMQAYLQEISQNKAELESLFVHWDEIINLSC